MQQLLDVKLWHTWSLPQMPLSADISRCVGAGEKVTFVGMPDETARKLPFPGAVALANMWQYLKEVCARA